MIADYIVARDLKQAFKVLAKHPNEAVILAGGTDIFLRLTKRERGFIVVDIASIEGLDQIRSSGREIEIGAAVTLSEILATSWLLKEVPSLGEAVSRIGSRQIRNQGTAVGNIMTGRASANLRVCTGSLGAYLRIFGPNGERIIEVDKLGFKRYKVERNEIAVSLVIPRGETTKASSYQFLTPRRGFSYVSASVSSSIRIDDGTLVKVSLIASPILPFRLETKMKPCNTCAGSCRICRAEHLIELEELLVGCPATEDAIEEACRKFDWQSLPMRDSSINGSAYYRQHLLKVLSKAALKSSLARSEKIV